MALDPGLLKGKSNLFSENSWKKKNITDESKLKIMTGFR